MIVDHVNLRKYPRVRGEERSHYSHVASQAEIPPRARGRVNGCRETVPKRGNTPACAGKRVRRLA